MQGFYYTTDSLVTALKRQSFAPEAGQAFSTTDFIGILNEELALTMTNELMKVRNNFFLKKKVINSVANVGDYPVPTRAIGNTIKDLYWIDGNCRAQITYRDIDTLRGYGTLVSNTPSSFFFFSDRFQLVATPSNAGQLEVWYYQARNKLVPVSQCGAVSAIVDDGTNLTFTIDADLTSLLEVGDTCDILSIRSPFDLCGEDVEIVAITASTVKVLKADVVDASGAIKVAVGDYVSVAGTTCVPMIPREYHPILVQMAVVSIMQPLAHLPKYGLATSKLEKMLAGAYNLVSHRVEMQPETLINSEGLGSFVGSGWPPTDLILK